MRGGVRRLRVEGCTFRLRPTPLGEAIRLLAFARGLARVRMESGITAANWQGWRLGPCETADDARARVSGELLFLGAWGPRLRPWVADELVPDPARPWPPAVSREELLALHDKTWERLGLLCQDDADVTGLVEELNAGPSACRISYERRPLTRRGPFTVADAPDAVSLAGHLDDLVVRTRRCGTSSSPAPTAPGPTSSVSRVARASASTPTSAASTSACRARTPPAAVPVRAGRRSSLASVRSSSGSSAMGKREAYQTPTSTRARSSARPHAKSPSCGGGSPAGQLDGLAGRRRLGHRLDAGPT